MKKESKIKLIEAKQSGKICPFLLTFPEAKNW
jgi:hypothetical protein